MRQVALITGGQRGIGLGIAEALVKVGWTVAITSPVAAAAAEVRAVLNHLGPHAVYVQQDLADITSRAQVIAEVEARAGAIDALIGNAGIPSPVRGDLLDLSAENYDAVMSVNTRGTFYFAQAVAKRMVAAPSDRFRSITFVTSVSAEVASIERADYCISKAASAMAAKLFASRLASEGISVFDLRPGIIKTPMTSPKSATYGALIAEGLVPARRWGTPEDVGTTVASLVSGKHPFSTGAVIPVDGGLGLHRL